MSYTLVSSHGLRKDHVGGWAPINVLTMTLSDIIAQYENVVFKLSNPLSAVPIVFTLAKNIGNLKPVTLTFSNWLLSANITTEGIDYSFTTTYANFSDALQSQYQITAVHPTYDPSIDVPDIDKTDLLLTRNGIDYLDMAKHCLFSLNGFFHFSEGSINGVYLRHARQSFLKSNDNHVGIFSFADVGEIITLPITADMLFTDDPAASYYKGVKINTGLDTDNYTIFVVIGGYLHVQDASYKVEGDGVISLDLRRLPLKERLVDSSRNLYIPILDPIFFNNTLVESMFRANTFITNYLTSSQSFVVAVKSNSIYSIKDKMPEPLTPGVYDAKYQHLGLLRNKWFKVLEYWRLSQIDRKILMTRRDWDTVATSDSSSLASRQVYIPRIDPNKPALRASAEMVNVVNQTLTITGV